MFAVVFSVFGVRRGDVVFGFTGSAGVRWVWVCVGRFGHCLPAGLAILEVLLRAVIHVLLFGVPLAADLRLWWFSCLIFVLGCGDLAAVWLITWVVADLTIWCGIFDCGVGGFDGGLWRCF